ncbi:MAG: IS3 family transposase, partial [Candidatus Izemoplasmatales bacterium]
GYGDLTTILHSDQGNIYSSKKFEQVHNDYLITRSMSRVATPTDNAAIESLNGWIKSDLKKNLRIQDFQDSYTAIEVYVNYFNNNRPSWKLNYLSHVEYRMINGIK